MYNDPSLRKFVIPKADVVTVAITRQQRDAIRMISVMKHLTINETLNTIIKIGVAHWIEPPKLD